MRVLIENGPAKIELEEPNGGYAPDVAADLCARAAELYKLAFADEDEESP